MIRAASDAGSGAAQDAEHAARLQLLHLPKMGPARARWLAAEGAVAGLALLRTEPARLGPAPRGVDLDLIRRWAAVLDDIDGAELLGKHRAAPWNVLDETHQLWPFTDDPEPPLLVFVHGQLEALAPERPRVAVVGTRRCTSIGRRVAHQLGVELTGAGVQIVSGLALGIDAAAHLGAAEAVEAGTSADAEPAPPLAVVATGLDEPYPRRNRELWDRIGDCGAVLTEAPLGTPAARWRFPARNRLIAALVDLVVVVESHEQGGALLTVDEAADRGRPIGAVPGSVLSPASAGTNALLVDGCVPVRDADDVLDLLHVVRPHHHRRRTQDLVDTAAVEASTPSPLGRLLLDELTTGDRHVDELLGAAARAGLAADLGRVLTEVAALETAGRVRAAGGHVTLA